MRWKKNEMLQNINGINIRLWAMPSQWNYNCHKWCNNSHMIHINFFSFIQNGNNESMALKNLFVPNWKWILNLGIFVCMPLYCVVLKSNKLFLLLWIALDERSTVLWYHKFRHKLKIASSELLFWFYQCFIVVRHKL